MSIDTEHFSLKDVKMEKKIGNGTFGDVYSGTYKPNGLRLAIKRVNKKKFIDMVII